MAAGLVPGASVSGRDPNAVVGEWAASRQPKSLGGGSRRELRAMIFAKAKTEVVVHDAR